jgi:hypothetical protein
MYISYQWAIKKLECVPLLEGNQNVVTSIFWELIGTDGRNNISSIVSGKQEILYTQPESFVDFMNLTEKQVLNWLFVAIGEAHIKAYEKIVAEKIDAIQNPKVVILDLPWVEVAQPE